MKQLLKKASLYLLVFQKETFYCNKKDSTREGLSFALSSGNIKKYECNKYMDNFETGLALKIFCGRNLQNQEPQRNF